VNFLISAMSEANTVARAPMADALGELGDERAIGSLVERLGDKTWDIQFAAAEAIGKIGGTQAAGALINWSKRIFSSELKKISAAEKSVLVGEVMSSFFKKLKDDELQSITAKLDDQVKIRSWLEAGDGAAPRWGDEIRENPVWAALKEEFSRRKSAPIHSPRTTQLANGERLFSPPDDEEVPLEELIEPAPVSEENSPANGAPIGHGPLKGIVADFLAFLEGQGQEDFVLVGGAVRDTILGRPPKDLDVTIQMKVSDELLAKRGDPMEWNLACSGHTNSALARLASVLNVSAGDLVHGRALFSSNGVSVPVHYVGPHLVEERRLTWRDLMVECKSHIVFSRIAMVADPARNRLTGLCGTTSVDHFWLDPHGRWCGESSRASADLRQKILQADSSPREARFWDLFRILYLKHLHGMTLSDSTVGILFRTAELLKANPDAAKTEFSQESFRRLVAAADLDHVVAELDLLDLLPALMDTLDASLLQDLNRIMMEKESRRTQSLQEAKRNLDAAQSKLKSQKEAYEAKRLEFNKHLDHLDVFKATRYDLEERLRAQIERLSEADKAARASAQRLEAATQKLTAVNSTGAVDVSVIQAHREALAAKREHDAEVAVLKKEVEAMRTAVDKKQASTIETQGKMEQLGKELESASKAYEDALAKAKEAGTALESVKAQLELSPESRRARLKAGA
ncbi:HEAT repeat domain-containing protein, partial [Candidatus Sumerlaeota bacterium]|nr:HEAT repeat domain-containing protein [Candidatus Sumerlaeota bacterium]